MDKSSKKTIFLCLVESRLEGYPRHPPPHREEIAHLTRGKCASAMRVRDFYLRNWRAGNGGGGETWNDAIQKRIIASTANSKPIPFSSFFYFDKMCLSPSGVLWQASAFLYSWAEPLKGSPSWQPALSWLHYILQSTSLWKKDVGHSNTRGTISLCSFPAEILLYIVCISNILGGLKVIDSRRLQ